MDEELTMCTYCSNIIEGSDYFCPGCEELFCDECFKLFSPVSDTSGKMEALVCADCAYEVYIQDETWF